MKRMFGPLQRSYSSFPREQPVVSLFEDATIKPFQTITSPNSLALSVPRTGLEKRINDKVKKTHLKIYLPVVKQAKEEARGEVEEREEKQKIHACRCIILKILK